MLDLLYPLRVAWRKSLQPWWEIHAANFRKIRSAKRFSRRDISVDPLVVSVFQRLTPVVAPPLKLVGGPYDGGYFVPENSTQDLVLFSCGVGHVVNFEYDFAERGHKVFLADGTVAEPPLSHSNFTFEAINIGLSPGEIALGTWIESHLQGAEVAAIQMDIEGAEWAALSPESISSEILSAVEWVVVEFHSIQRLWEGESRPVMLGVIDRMLEFFVPVSVHSNNCAPALPLDNREFPSVFEVTFLNKRMHRLVTSENVFFPDFQNCNRRPPVIWPIGGNELDRSLTK